MSGKVNGHHVLYHFLEKELQHSDAELFRALVARLIVSLGIWFSPETYQAVPILVPYAV